MTLRHRTRIIVTATIIYEQEDKRWRVSQIKKQRYKQGDFHNSVQELWGDEKQFYLYFPRIPRRSDVLLRLVGPSLRRKDAQLPFHSPILFHALSFICFFQDELIKASEKHAIILWVMTTNTLSHVNLSNLIQRE